MLYWEWGYHLEFLAKTVCAVPSTYKSLLGFVGKHHPIKISFSGMQDETTGRILLYHFP